MEIKITETQAKAYLDAIFTAHVLMNKALRKLENDQMISGNPVCDRTRTLLNEIDAIEELGMELELVLNGE